MDIQPPAPAIPPQPSEQYGPASQPVAPAAIPIMPVQAPEQMSQNQLAGNPLQPTSMMPGQLTSPQLPPTQRFQQQAYAQQQFYMQQQVQPQQQFVQQQLQPQTAQPYAQVYQQMAAPVTNFQATPPQYAQTLYAQQPSYPAAQGFIGNIESEEKVIEARIHSRALQALHRFEKPMTIIVVVLVLAFSAANIAFSLHIQSVRHDVRQKVVDEARKAYADSPEAKTLAAQKAFGAEIVDRPSGKLDMSQQIDSEYSNRTQSLQAKLNQQINFTNGLSYIITGVQTDWHSSLEYATQPKAGSHFIKLTLSIGNRSNAQVYPDLSQLSANVNGTIVLHVGHYISNDDLANGETAISDTTSNLDPKEVRTGETVIEVPNGPLPHLILKNTGYAYGRGGELTEQVEITL
jgi:hypothetical protein